MVKREKVEVKEEVLEVKKVEDLGVTIQVVGGIRSFSIPRTDVIKIHRGTPQIANNHPRLSKMVLITPKTIATIKTPRAKWLLTYNGVQKYGVEKL